ncbi:aldehyde dehydrogenase family protein, partial [Winslowiella iniecta]
MRYAYPGYKGSLITLQQRYGNFINGEFVAPVQGEYFSNTSPINGSVVGEFPRSGAQDVDNAVAAAHAAAEAWGKTSVQVRSLTLLK